MVVPGHADCITEAAGATDHVPQYLDVESVLVLQSRENMSAGFGAGCGNRLFLLGTPNPAVDVRGWFFLEFGSTPYIREKFCLHTYGIHPNCVCAVSPPKMDS